MSFGTVTQISFTLNAAVKKIDCILSDVQADIDAAAHATLDTEQLISHTRTVVADTVASVQDSDKDVILVSKVHELLTKILDIVYNAVCKKAGNGGRLYFRISF